MDFHTFIMLIPKKGEMKDLRYFKLITYKKKKVFQIDQFGGKY